MDKQLLLKGMKVFLLRDGMLYEVEFLRYTKRGTSGFFRSCKDNQEFLGALSKVYATREEGIKGLKEYDNRMNKKYERMEKERECSAAESEAISEIFFKIYMEFDIRIPKIMQPSTLKDAKELYRELERENRRN